LTAFFSGDGDSSFLAWAEAGVVEVVEVETGAVGRKGGSLAFEGFFAAAILLLLAPLVRRLVVVVRWLGGEQEGDSTLRFLKPSQFGLSSPSAFFSSSSSFGPAASSSSSSSGLALLRVLAAAVLALLTLGDGVALRLLTVLAEGGDVEGDFAVTEATEAVAALLLRVLEGGMVEVSV